MYSFLTDCGMNLGKKIHFKTVCRHIHRQQIQADSATLKLTAKVYNATSSRAADDLMAAPKTAQSEKMHTTEHEGILNKVDIYIFIQDCIWNPSGPISTSSSIRYSL